MNTNINCIKRKKILVIGDVMLDTYYLGDIKRISPEAPVPVFLKNSEYSVLGGAANVASNLVAAGQEVYVMSIVGNDDNGKKLIKLFETQGVQTKFIFPLDRITTDKVRFLANNNQQVLRLDQEDTKPITEAESDSLLDVLSKEIGQFDLVVLSDYLKGLLTEMFTQGVIKLAKEKGVNVIVDVKDPNVSKYKDAYLIKPNLKELRELTGMPVSNKKEIVEAAEILRKECACKYILATCGANGMVLIGEEVPFFIDAVDQEVFDVTGAGDTTIAYLAACMVNHLMMKESVVIANYAAGIQVSKVGTSPVYWREIRDFICSTENQCNHKIISRAEIENFRNSMEGKKIVFTNGCFDILHIGHIRYLQKAAKLGDILVVGVNSDASVKRLKGEERPINPETDRTEMLAALSFVNYVVVFEEDTPLEIIKLLRPDVLVKGGDYSDKYVVGSEEVEKNGGKLVLIPFVEGKSTTNIINKIKK